MAKFYCDYCARNCKLEIRTKGLIPAAIGCVVGHKECEWTPIEKPKKKKDSQSKD